MAPSYYTICLAVSRPGLHLFKDRGLLTLEEIISCQDFRTSGLATQLKNTTLDGTRIIKSDHYPQAFGRHGHAFSAHLILFSHL